MTTKKTTAKPKSAKTKKPAKPRGAAAIQVVEDKPKPVRNTKVPKEPKEKKLSALDAAAKVLGGSKEPMTSGQMIETMAAKGLWTSPGGKTPAATLYSAILREIGTKGKESRFTKTERGKFAAKA